MRPELRLGSNLPDSSVRSRDVELKRDPTFSGPSPGAQHQPVAGVPCQGIPPSMPIVLRWKAKPASASGFVVAGAFANTKWQVGRLNRPQSLTKRGDATDHP